MTFDFLEDVKNKILKQLKHNLKIILILLIFNKNKNNKKINNFIRNAIK